jgi:hypothetical protein
MPSSNKPFDVGRARSSRREIAPVERVVLSLGQFTANTTVTPAPRLVFDRAAIIREVWIVASAIPADPDGTMLANVLIHDTSEAGSDTIVSSQDLETLITEANKSYEMTLASEGTENELTVAAGDSLRATLVNNSAAIGTNADISLLVIFQVIEPVT